jgi:hypothetical protein
MPSGLLFGMPVLWHVVVMGNRDFGISMFDSE